MLAYPTTRLISQKDDLHAQKTKINYNFRKNIYKWILLEIERKKWQWKYTRKTTLRIITTQLLSIVKTQNKRLIKYGIREHQHQ